MDVSLKPTIIPLQETIMEGTKATGSLEPWFKDWSFTHISSERHSGGLLTAWSLDFVEIKTKKHNTVLKTTLKEKSFGKIYVIYDVYGPYQNRKVFWKYFFSSGLLEPKNMILGGDLNLTLSEKEN